MVFNYNHYQPSVWQPSIYVCVPFDHTNVVQRRPRQPIYSTNPPIKTTTNHWKCTQTSCRAYWIDENMTSLLIAIHFDSTFMNSRIPRVLNLETHYWTEWVGFRFWLFDRSRIHSNSLGCSDLRQICLGPWNYWFEFDHFAPRRRRTQGEKRTANDFEHVKVLKFSIMDRLNANPVFQSLQFLAAFQWFRFFLSFIHNDQRESWIAFVRTFGRSVYVDL